MRRTGACLLVLLAVSLALPAVPACAVEPGEPLKMSVPNIITIDRELDGATVQFMGEAIGEDLRADSEHRWINILEQGVAIGVLVTNAQAEQITTYGDHGNLGAIVEVIGPVHIAWDERGGEFGVAATEFRIVAPGKTIERPVAPWKAIVAVIALLLALAEILLFRHIRERRLA